MMQMKGSLLFAILCFLLLTQAMGQQSRGNQQARYLTKFPFTQLTGGIIVLKAVFNDIPDSLNFILDTGSGAISLDSTTAAEFHIPNYPSGRTISGIAGRREVNYTRYNTLKLPGLKVDSLDFYINDYNILSSVYGIKVDGIIGYSFLSRYIVSINYDSMFIQVYTPGIFNYPKGATLLHPKFTSLVIQQVEMKDQRDLKSNVYLDTGAGLCFLVTDRFAADSSFFQKKRKPVSVQVQGVGGKKEMLVTIVKKVKLGPYTFRKVPTNILHDEVNTLSYPFVGGLLGNDILRRFNVVLNYDQKIIALKMNSHYREPFDFSYTGMNMYLEEGQIVIDDIVDKSPASKAGLKNGDVVIAVGADFSGSISEYKNRFQNAKEKVPMIILRDGILKKVELRVGRIY